MSNDRDPLVPIAWVRGQKSIQFPCLTVRTRSQVALDNGVKACFRCRRVKPLTEYTPSTRGIADRHAYCHDCRAEYERDRNH